MRNDCRTNFREIISNILLGQANNREPFGFEIFSFSLVACLLGFFRMPIITIAFENNIVMLQQKVTAVSSDFSLLNIRYAAPLQEQANLFFYACLACVLAITGQVAKPSSVGARHSSKSLPAIVAICVNGGAVARFGAVFWNPSSLARLKHFSTPLAFVFSYACMTAFNAANGISIFNASQHSELFEANGALLGNFRGGSLTTCFCAILFAFSNSVRWQIKLNAALRTSFVNTCSFSFCFAKSKFLK